MHYVEERLFVLFEFGISGLYIAGVGIVLFGSILMLTRYIRAKIKAPLEPSKFILHATYLTVGLEVLIAAEIISTVVSRTLDDFLHLGLTVAIRFGIALVLFFERKGERHLDAHPA